MVYPPKVVTKSTSLTAKYSLKVCLIIYSLPVAKSLALFICFLVNTSVIVEKGGLAEPVTFAKYLMVEGYNHC